MKFVILMLTVIGAAGAVVPDPIDELVAELASRAFISDLSVITPHNQAAVIAKLKQVAYGGPSTNLGTAIVGRDNARVILIRLGDTAAIEKLVSNFEKYDSRAAVDHVPDLLLGARQPLVIPSLARSLFENDAPNQAVAVEEDVIGPPRSIWAGVLVTRVIRRCSEFTPELKSWATEMERLRGEDPNIFREVMQAWWKENADAFQRKDFAAVKPLSQPAPASPAPPEETTVPDTVPSAPAVATTPAPPVPVSSAATSTPSTGSLWGVALVAAALLAALLLFWKRRA